MGRVSLTGAGPSSDLCGGKPDRTCARAPTARIHDSVEAGQLNDGLLRARSEINGYPIDHRR